MKQDILPIIAHLNKLHYASPDWSSDAQIESRGLGVRIVNDPNVSTQKQDQVPQYGK